MKLLTSVVTAVGLFGSVLPYPAQSAPASRWVSIGPAAVRGGYYGSVSGRISDIQGSSNGDLVVATAGGGVWRLRHGRTNWEPSMSGIAAQTFGALGHSGPIWYAASGEYHGLCIDCAPGSGIYKSIDGGFNWWLLPNSQVQARSTIVRVSPNDPNEVWVGGTGGLFKSTDGGESFKPVKRLGGFFENPSSVIVQKTGAIIVSDETGIYKSPNRGVVWTKTNANPLSKIPNAYAGTRFSTAIAVSPSDPEVMVASFAYIHTYFRAGCLAAMYKSIDGGDTWQELKDVPDYFSQAYSYPQGGTECQGWYDNTLAISPLDPNEIVAGGIALIRSRDGGKNWQNLSAEKKLHPDQHALYFDSAGDLYIGNDGGVWVVRRNNDDANLNTNLPITQFYGGGSMYKDGVVVSAGAQDNGISVTSDAFGADSTNQSQHFDWTTVMDGDGGFTALSSADDQKMYLEREKGLMFRTDDRRDPRPRFVQIPPKNSSVSFGKANWVMPFTVLPSDWRTVYAAADAIYRTNDSGDTWTAISDKFAYPAVSLAVSSDENVVVAGLADTSLVFRTSKTDNFSSTGAVSQEPIVSIVLDPQNERHVFVASRDNTSWHVLENSNIADVASVWSDITGDLQCFPNVLFLFDQQLLVGCDKGVYLRSTGSNWVPFGTGLPQVSVVDLLLSPSFGLLALTHGRGAWVLRLH